MSPSLDRMTSTEARCLQRLGTGVQRVGHQKVLVLGGAGPRGKSLLSQFVEQDDIRIVDSWQEAVEAIQGGHIELVLSEAGDFLPGHCEQCARWINQALGASGEGVASVSPEGEILWANTAFQSMPRAILSAVVGTCLSVSGEWRRRDVEAASTQRAVERLTVPDEAGAEKDFEVAVSPVLDRDGRLTQLAAVVRDVTTTVQFQRKIQAVEQAGQQLVRLNAEQFASLSVPQRVAKIEEQIVTHTRRLMNCHRFSIRLIDSATGKLNVAMAQGMSEAVWHREIDPSADGQGICGYVAATQRSYLCPDTPRDPRYVEGMSNAGSSLTVPMWLHDDLVGVFNVESDRINAFDDVDRQLLEAFSRHVAMALKILDLLVFEGYESTGRFADDVTAEIAGPLNDILTDASALMSEYIGDHTLCERLKDITEKVGKIRHSFKQAAKPTNGFRGTLEPHKTVDPFLAGKRLLVADDEDAIRETLHEVLSKQGCDVDMASDGAQAINMLDNRRYDLVLADIRMPRKNGYEVFAIAKEKSPDCPVILITGFGYDPNHSIVRARQEGLAAVLFKPFKVDQLLDEVREALHQPVNG